MRNVAAMKQPRPPHDPIRDPARELRPGRPASAIVLAALLLQVAASGTSSPPSGARAAEPTAVDAGQGPDESRSLVEREQELARQFRDLEKTFLRLADLLAGSDPRRSALLRSVFAQAREEEVGNRLDTIVQLLEKGQLLKAGTSQAGAIEKLRQLLDLLESGDTDRRLANTKEEVKQFLSRLSKLISRQRDIEGSTEAGGREARLSERQDALAEETRGLSADIDGFAKRMESRDQADGDPSGSQGGKNPTGREADGMPSKPGEPGEKDDQPGAKGDDAKGDDSPDDPAKTKPGESAEPSGPAADGKSGDGKSSDKQSGEQSGEEGESSGNQEGAKEQPAGDESGDDESSRARRTKKRLQAAEKRMRQARDKLDEAKRREARSEQEKAIEELETARAELEEILRQMREEEVERLLIQLGARIRAMLRAEKAVLAGTEKIAGVDPSSDRQPPSDRERQLEAARLGREQAAISNDASRALTLVRDDGSAVAIPEALEQVRDDSVQAAARLARGDVGGTTRGILQDLVANLEEMLGALEKAQREQQARQQNPSGGRPAEPGQQPLVDKLSELKMIRSLQMRVNTRTKRFAQLLADGAEQAEEPELLDALDRLSARQRKIERAAHDIVTGRTE